MKYVETSKWQILEGLDKESGQELLVELMALYRKNTPETLSKINLALKQNNLKELVLRSHNLKSTSANLGVSFISERAKKIEALCLRKESITQTQVKQIEILLAEIEEIFPLVIEELNQL